MVGKTTRNETLMDLLRPNELNSAITLASSNSLKLLIPTTTISIGDSFISTKSKPTEEEAPQISAKVGEDPAVEAHPPATFHSLSEDVRKTIWTHALPGPRIIELTILRKNIVSRARVPTLLHTCRESRAVALKHYTLAFGHNASPPKVYFDFRYDWIYTRCPGCLGANCSHKSMLTGDHSRLRHLVYEGPISFNPFTKILRFFPDIRGVILIRGKSKGYRDEIDSEEFVHLEEGFEWAGDKEPIELAKEAWKDINSTQEKLKLKRVWRCTLPNLVDDGKRREAGKGLWTCCF